MLEVIPPKPTLSYNALLSLKLQLKPKVSILPTPTLANGLFMVKLDCSTISLPYLNWLAPLKPLFLNTTLPIGSIAFTRHA